MRSSVGFIFALLLGGYFVFEGFRGYPFAMDSLAGGVTTILGTFAYRSAKLRRLGLRPDTKLRRAMEIVAVVLVVTPLVILAAEGNEALRFYPLSGIAVPAGTLAAFVWLFRRGKTASGDPRRLIR